MGVLNEFDQVWAAARALVGDPSSTGPAMSPATVPDLPERAAGSWLGDGANRYRVDADTHHRALGHIGDLDAGAERDLRRAPAIAERALRDIDSVRQRVYRAAAAVPVGNQRVLAGIAGVGCRDVAATIERTRCELGGISGGLSGTGAGYRSLSGRSIAEAGPDHATVQPDPVAEQEPGDDDPSAGTPTRPLLGVLTPAEWRIARLSPTLLDDWEDAKAKGWRITTETGVGTFTRPDEKVINLDPALAGGGPTQRVSALAHELGHALRDPGVDRRTREGYVSSMLDGEGAAVWNTISVEREILAAGGRDIIAPGLYDDIFERYYDEAGTDPQAYRDAIHRIGQRYATFTPSTDLTKNYHQYYSDGYRCSILNDLFGRCER